ncbi:septation protein IspZ, partial [Escherichia coli]|uniref:septation protein IspZ n=1 Tax=Escherichia coli TaxID=562 RepID=UPI00202513CC
DEFIKWKVTVIYALFAGALLVSQWVMKKPLIQRMLGKELTRPQPVLLQLNPDRAGFFFLLGLGNISPPLWPLPNLLVMLVVLWLSPLSFHFLHVVFVFFF